MSQIAATIQAQLGGNKFVAMTGAHSFMATEVGLNFRIGRGAKSGINLVTIKLEPTDLYSIEFFRVRGFSVKSIAKREMVYADQLQSVFTSETGMYTSL